MKRRYFHLPILIGILAVCACDVSDPASSDESDPQNDPAAQSGARYAQVDSGGVTLVYHSDVFSDADSMAINCALDPTQTVSSNETYYRVAEATNKLDKVQKYTNGSWEDYISSFARTSGTYTAYALLYSACDTLYAFVHGIQNNSDRREWVQITGRDSYTVLFYDNDFAFGMSTIFEYHDKVYGVYGHQYIFDLATAEYNSGTHTFQGEKVSFPGGSDGFSLAANSEHIYICLGTSGSSSRSLLRIQKTGIDSAPLPMSVDDIFTYRDDVFLVFESGREQDFDLTFSPLRSFTDTEQNLFSY